MADQADQIGSAHFEALFESALQAYQEKTGVKLAQHPLSVELQRCHVVDDLDTFLRGQVEAINNFRERDRMVKAIKTIVSILTPLSKATSLADAVGLTFIPHAKAIHASLGHLLDAANGVISSYDILADLLESIQGVVDHLKLHTPISPMPEIDNILIKQMVALISILTWVTRKLNGRRPLILAKDFFAVKDIKQALRRLDRLIQEEMAVITPQIREDVHGLKSRLIDDGKAPNDSVQNVPGQTTSGVDQSKRPLSRDQLRDDIHKWLSPPDPWINYNLASKSRHGDTGAWFVNGPTLSDWKESGPSSLLWIHGKPGAGKSVICSTVIKDIEMMRTSGRASLAIYYYTFAEDQKKDLRGLLSSVIYQLYDQSDSFYNILSNFYSAHRGRTQSPSDDDLVECLKALLRNPGPLPIYLIIDGLDECPRTSAMLLPRIEVLSLLEDLVEGEFTNLRICVTSRPETDIQAILEPLAFCSVSLHREGGQNKDIQKYIESFVTNDRHMKFWKPEERHLVINFLTERADGMFRWADCQLKYLANCIPAQIKQALDTLPVTLDETYERTLREIREERWEDARRLLLCVAASSRPLRVEELSEILAFDFEEGPVPRFHEAWRLENPVDAVLSTCSTLLSVVKQWNSQQVVRFAHFTVKEFLISPRFAGKDDTISRRYCISMASAHTLIARACLGILLHLDKNVTRDSLVKFPLTQYAAEHWFEHVRFEGVSKYVTEGVKQLFDRRRHHLAVWLWISDPTVPYSRRDNSTKLPLAPRGTPLHYAAFCGLHDYVEVLAIESPEDMDSRNFEDGSTPLHLALVERHVAVVRLLVEHRAGTSAASAQTNDGRTSLHVASEWGDFELAQFLLEHGANPSAQTNDGQTSLHVASKRGDLELPRLLLKYGAEAAARNAYGGTPLHRACWSGHVELSRLLIEHGADAAAQTKDGWTPLHLVSDIGYLALARLLVEHGADAAALSKDGWTPLHIASEKGHVGLINLFSKHGIHTTAQTEPPSQTSILQHFGAMAQPILPRFPNVKIRILVVGRANAGKTTIIQRVADAMECSEVYRRDNSGNCELCKLEPSIERGEHDIEDELILTNHANHDEYIFHDSRGFEAGFEDETGIVQEFVHKRSLERRLEDKLHAIWYCVPMDNVRPGPDLMHFAGIHAITNVPMIVVFTKYGHFKRTIGWKLRDMNRSPTLGGAEVERIFYEYYLSCLSRSTPFVLFEGIKDPNQRYTKLMELTVKYIDALDDGTFRAKSEAPEATRTNEQNSTPTTPDCCSPIPSLIDFACRSRQRLARALGRLGSTRPTRVPDRH